MISPVDIAFSDLMAVPGVRGVILVDGNSASRVYRLDFEMSRDRIESLVRGVGQLIRRLGKSTRRIDLRCVEGRFVIQALSEGIVVAILTDNKPNIPLLSLSLDQLTTATLADHDRVLDTFKAGEILLLQSQEYQSRPSAAERHLVGEPVSIEPASIEPASIEPASIEPTVAAPTMDGSDGPGMRLDLQVQARQVEDALFAEFGMSQSEVPPPPATTAQVRAVVTPGRPATTGECASALTRASSVVARFLGRSVIANYWRQTASAANAGAFDVHQDGSIVAIAPDMILSEQSRQSTMKWTADFLKRCSLIVFDLPRELEGTLDDEARGFLFGTI